MPSMGTSQLNALPPVLDVTINGKRERVDTSNVAGDGGEAIVIRHKTWAVKVLHTTMRTKNRLKKLEKQIKRQPPTGKRTVRPLYPVTDTATGNLIGSAMMLIDMSMYEQLTWWMKKQHRQDNHIEFKDICAVFYEVKDELDTNHAAGYVIGDFNPGGILVLKKQYWTKGNDGERVKFVDADSLEFDEFPCYVYSLNWFDYKLVTDIDKIGTKTGIYTKLSDYFSFDALFFQALTTAGIYSGTHDLFTGIKRWMSRGLTAIHPEVEYPDDAVPFTALPDKFQAHFKASFIDGKRVSFPIDALKAALGMQIDLQPRQQPVTVATAGMTLRVLHDSLGAIIDFMVEGETVHILCRNDQDGRYYYAAIFDGVLNIYQILDTVDFAKYRIISGGWVGEIRDQRIGAYTATLKIKHVTDQHSDWQEVVTQVGLNGEPIFGGGAGNLLYSSNNYLSWQSLENPSKQNMLHSISAFTAIRYDQVTGNSVGMSRTGQHYSWFFTRGNVAYDVQIGALEDTESLEDWDALYTPGGRSALVIRRTVFQGAIRTRFDEVSLSSSWDDSKRLLLDGRKEDGDLLDPLKGAIYMNQGGQATILYATNSGITRFNLVTGAVNVFDSTKGAVRRGDVLRLYKNDLVAIGDGRVVVVSLR